MVGVYALHASHLYRVLCSSDTYILDTVVLLICATGYYGRVGILTAAGVQHCMFEMTTTDMYEIIMNMILCRAAQFLSCMQAYAFMDACKQISMPIHATMHACVMTGGRE